MILQTASGTTYGTFWLVGRQLVSPRSSFSVFLPAFHTKQTLRNKTCRDVPTEAAFIDELYTITESLVTGSGIVDAAHVQINSSSSLLS